jgi:hypothetical protein
MQMPDSNPKGDLNSIAFISASSTISTPSSEPSGLKPRDFTIKREQNSRYEHDNGLDIDGSDRARLRVERAIMICYAGPLSQQRHRPRSWRRRHGASDFQTAADLAIHVSGSDEIATAFLRWLELQTMSIVVVRWALIDRVAQALLEHNQLAGQDIVALCSR